MAGFLNSLILRIKGDNKGLKQTLNDSEKASNKFGDAIKKLGGVIAAAFSVQAIVAFGKEAVRLASQVEGVRTAFNQLDDPMLLYSLRKATRGTVDDLTLMQKAVQARNFKIPLEQLATYFEFATNRAIQTGESVDYLVDSIITGIGRKSVLVMDNLGISAVELQDEVKRVGDFGAAAGVIIQRELEKAGEVADTTATFRRKQTLEDIKPFEEAITAEIKKQTEERKKQAAIVPRSQNVGIGLTPANALTNLPQIETGVKSLTTSLRDMSNAWNEVRYVMDAATQEAVIQVSNWQGLMEGAIMQFSGFVEGMVEQIFTSLGSGDFSGLFDNILSSFGQFIVDMGKMLVAYGTLMLAFSILSKSPDPISAGLAIGAGLAAIAVGSAIKGAASRGQQALSGGGGAAGGYSSRGGGANMQAQNLVVYVEGTLKGSDIAISSRRYSDNISSVT